MQSKVKNVKVALGPKGGNAARTEVEELVTFRFKF